MIRRIDGRLSTPLIFKLRHYRTMATPHATNSIMLWFVQRPRPSIDPSPPRYGHGHGQRHGCVVHRFPGPSGPIADDAEQPVPPKPPAGVPWIDPFTGLPNHRAFYRRLSRTLRSAAHAGQEVALFVVDVDDFDMVNDAYGSACGDAIVRLVGHRLSAGQAPSLDLARVDSARFAFAVSGPNVVAGARMAAHRIRRAFRLPIVIGGFAIPTTVSIGIGLYPNYAATVNNLIAAALQGTNMAKRRGGDAVARGASADSRLESAAYI
jgi:diguanylate cyclase (GGDEF)-like protein